jgi:2,5-diketo-D-gluconate reductase A
MIDTIKQSPILHAISERTGKTIGQVILRWHYQHGSVPCFKSLKPNRLAENFDIWDFELTEEDMRRIHSMNEDYKYHIESASCPGY